MNFLSENLRYLILVGGLVHFSILLASALVPSALNWRDELAGLSRLVRQLIWVHGAFIVLVIVSFGMISLVCSSELASGSPLARAVCAVIAVFWGARLGIQFLIFDAKPYLTNTWLKLGYHTLSVAFVLLTAIYAFAAAA